MSRSGDRDLPWLARDPSGMPPRYLFVSIPCASGLNAMQPMPRSPRVSSRPPSIQRFTIEYEGWWMSSGTPISSSRSAARAVSSGP